AAARRPGRGALFPAPIALPRRTPRPAGVPPPAQHRSSARRAPRAERAPTLSVRDLAVRFGGVAALAGVSFDVHPGTITSVIGPNGAGKTTAFNAITGYLRPTRGRIEYVGVPLMGLRPSAIAARGIVRTFQRTSVFPSLSVTDNVMIGPHLRGSAGVLDVLLGWRRRAAEESRLPHDPDGILEFVGPRHRPGSVASALAFCEHR